MYALSHSSIICVDCYNIEGSPRSWEKSHCTPDQGNVIAYVLIVFTTHSGNWVVEFPLFLLGEGGPAWLLPTTHPLPGQLLYK